MSTSKDRAATGLRLVREAIKIILAAVQTGNDRATHRESLANRYTAESSGNLRAVIKMFLDYKASRPVSEYWVQYGNGRLVSQ